MKDKIQFSLLIFGIALFAFLGGNLTASLKVWPFPALYDATRTLWGMVKLVKQTSYIGQITETTTLPPADAAKNRWTLLDTSAPRLPILINGGLNQFLEMCPGKGCLAVVYGADGKAVTSIPFFADKLYAADITKGAYPHEMVAFDPFVNSRPIGVELYSNGDVLASFQSYGTVFPFAMGISRVAPNGEPRWTRYDYSHHWTYVRPDDVAYVPSLKIGEKSIALTLGDGPYFEKMELACDTNRPQLDTVNVVDGAGKVVEEIDVTSMLVKSNWMGILPETSDPCDPLHLNFATPLTTPAGPGLNPGDLVVSLRNLSRFMILDRETRQIKRMVGGTFIQQHAVQQLQGSKFLIFDNHGGDAEGPASRVIELDLATGQERRVFPNALTPPAYARLFTDKAGHIDVSPDRTRLLTSFSLTGRGFEIDIASGRLLSIYDHLHDVSTVENASDNQKKHAVRYNLFGMSYAR
jgi:hypothetical protein